MDSRERIASPRSEISKQQSVTTLCHVTYTSSTPESNPKNLQPNPQLQTYNLKLITRYVSRNH